MVILVTGTAGFIGYHMAKRLLEEGHEVVGIDNLNDYYAVDLKRARHDGLKDNNNFHQYEIDLCDLQATKAVFEKHNPEIVCNLAAQVGVRYSLINPFAYEESNLKAYLNLIDLSRVHEVKRFVYASSSSVYGGSKELPFKENQSVDSPISLYAATKKANELIAHSYSHLYDIQTVGLRFFTVYGPFGRPDMAVWLFTEAISNGTPIKVFNNGELTRDLTFIDDVVSGVHASLFSKDLEKCSVYNIGNNKSEKLMDLISVIERAVGKEAIKEYLPMQPGDMYDTYANIDKASKDLGFSPKTSIDVGLPIFAEWYLENPRLAKAVIASRQQS